MSTIHCSLTKWGVVWYIPKGPGRAGMETVTGDWVMSPSFLQGILRAFQSASWSTHSLSFSRSKVRWVKCVRLFWPITVVNAHFLGNSKSKGKAKFVLAGSSQNQLTSSGNSPYHVCFLEFNLGQTARWAFYLFHQPGLSTWNHLGQPEMSTYW